MIGSSPDSLLNKAANDALARMVTNDDDDPNDALARMATKDATTQTTRWLAWSPTTTTTPNDALARMVTNDDDDAKASNARKLADHEPKTRAARPGARPKRATSRTGTTGC